MTKIKEAFKKKSFIAFLTAGDPSINKTEEFIYAMIEAGVSLIEIGIPFSDPLAEGPIIAQADVRALKGKTRLNDIFNMVKRIRTKYPNFPLCFMTYLNPVFKCGYENFFLRSKECGMDGIIIPDLPFEEHDEVKSVAKKYDVEVISMIAPTSEERISLIAEKAEGFIYLVSSLGVTGVRDRIDTDLGSIIKRIRVKTNLPIAIGFGIKTEEMAKKMSSIADGVIVGSAIVQIIEEHGEDAKEPIISYCKKMINALS